MTRFKLCRNDPLIKTLRDTFGANPVRVPEHRIQPLCVVAARGDQTAFRGELKYILTGDLDLPDWSKAKSPMTNVKKNRSGSIDIKLGFDILEKFMCGFGVPAPGISAHFKGATEVAFSFRDVVRDWVDDNWLGRALRGRSIDQQNKAARIYINKPQWRLLVIDSVIKSRDFTIAVTKSKSQSVAIDVAAISELAGKAKAEVSVSSASSSEVTFTGSDYLTFAFTALEFHVDDYGNITAMPPGGDWAVLAVGGDDYMRTLGPASVELSKHPVMIEWDEVDPTADVLGR